MKQTGKRLCSLLLALIMVLGIFADTGLLANAAESDSPPAVEEAASNTEAEETAAEPVTLAVEDAPALAGDFVYIRSLTIAEDGIVDGTEPWDYKTDSAEKQVDNTDDGFDGSPSNRRVRTFDSVTYTFTYQTAGQNNYPTNAKYASARVYFEFLLPTDQSEAYFETEGNGWLSAAQYRYEKQTTTINGIAYQVLHGSFLWTPASGDVSAAEMSGHISVRVLSMVNESTVQPIFSAWMEYNDVGVSYDKQNIPTGVAYGNGSVCAAHGNKSELATVTPDEVTVTCTPRYAVTLKRGETATTAWKGNFNFFTGNDSALDKDIGTYNGEISGYGIRLMVKGLDAEHGLRGCEFPKPGDKIEFKISMTTQWKSSNGGDMQYVTNEFVPRVWSADEFAYGTQGDGRAVGGYNGAVSYGAPLNYDNGDKDHSCKNGGTWTFGEPEIATWNGNHRVLNVTVSGYEFDPEHLPFTYERGGTTDTEYYNPETVGNEYWNIQNAVFSTGEIWVVTPFYNAPGTETAHYITNVKNEQSLTMYQDIYARDLVVKNASDVEKFRKWAENDHLSASITLKNPGNYDTCSTLLKPLASAYNDPLTPGCWSGGNDLKDYATPGSYVDLETYVFNDNATEDSTAVAYNVMTKFDNACFEPVTMEEMKKANIEGAGFGAQVGYASQAWYAWPEYTQCSDYIQGWDWHPPKMLYGTTKDKHGWDHKSLMPDQAGYDDEMMKATPDDLIWYDSMEALKADGANALRF